MMSFISENPLQESPKNAFREKKRKILQKIKCIRIRSKTSVFLKPNLLQDESIIATLIDINNL